MKCKRLQSLLVLLEFISYSRMRTTHLLTVSRSIRCISGTGVCPPPPDADPQMQIPPDEDPPEADPLCTELHTRVKTLPCPKLRLRAVTR